MFRTKKQKEELANDLVALSKKNTRTADILSRLVRNKLGMLGMIIIAILLILVIFAPVFTDYPYDAQSFPDRFINPCWEHPLGTDNFGRDLWSRMLYGGRISLLVSLVAIIISSAVGITVGAIAGFFGGRIDNVITRILDILMAIPALLMAIAVSSALGTGPMKTALAIAISGIPYSARVMRSTVLTIKDNEYIEAAQATGSTNARTIFKHVLPNTIAPLIVSATLDIGGNIMAISGLSFIGLGVQAPTPEWGSILSAGREFLRDFPPIVIFPALFIGLTLFGFNILGDALRDALDPRLKD
ncbi:MAG: ABC transporter permease [Oscillospiraceae bacterium]|nr:ABC transporter permease [Oscillospiraceae bacterium]